MEKAEARARVGIDALLDRRITVLEKASSFAEVLDREEKEIECPACGQSISQDTFTRHIQDELEELKKARSVQQAARKAREALARSLRQLGKMVEEKEIAEWLEEPPNSELAHAVNELSKIDVTRSETGWSPEEMAIFREAMPLITSRVEEALRVSPPSAKQMVDDLEKAEACALIPKIIALEEETAHLTRLIRSLSASEMGVRKILRLRTKGILERISGEIQHLWSELHPKEPIEGIQPYIPRDADKAIDIRLKFHGVDQPSPRLALSEGHRNSLGLCIFLAITRIKPNEDRPIILDDIVSSFDRNHRGMLVYVLLQDFKNRQVLLFTHDREWFTELRCRLPSSVWKFSKLLPWRDPRVGIQLSDKPGRFEDARALVCQNPESAGSEVRKIMDWNLSIAAEYLHIGMPYVRGDRNDRRTFKDFLERIISEAKTRLRKKEGDCWRNYLGPVASWEEALNLLLAWANRSSHTGSLAVVEAERLIDVCEAAWDLFRCSSCGDSVWSADNQRKERVQCTCGQMQWRYD